MPRKFFKVLDYPEADSALLHGLKPFAQREEQTWQHALNAYRGIWGVEGRIRLYLRRALRQDPLLQGAELDEMLDRSLGTAVYRDYGSMAGLREKAKEYMERAQDPKSAQRVFKAQNTLNHLTSMEDVPTTERGIIMARKEGLITEISDLLGQLPEGNILDATGAVLQKEVARLEVLRTRGNNDKSVPRILQRSSRGRRLQARSTSRHIGDPN